MEQLSEGMGRPIPLACGDWANAKAAYRFLDNDRVSEREILAGHFQATQERFAAVDGPILVLHDTTEFSFTRENTQAVGLTHKVVSGRKNKDGRPRTHTLPPAPARRRKKRGLYPAVFLRRTGEVQVARAAHDSNHHRAHHAGAAILSVRGLRTFSHAF